MATAKSSTKPIAVGGGPDVMPASEISNDKLEGCLQSESEGYLVTFNKRRDPCNPKDWSAAKKWAVTSVLSATGFNRIMVSTIMAPALTVIATDLDMSIEESVMTMSVYLIATALGPLAIGPLSEEYGRAPVLHATNIWFLVWNLVCGFAPHKGLLLAARLLAGFGASAIYALGGGVLGDVWPPEQRGRSLGLYLLIPLLGAAIGPIVGGYITEYTNWRWIFWSTSCFQAAMVVFSFVFFEETFAPIILRKRAKRLRGSTGEVRYQTAAEKLNEGQSAVQVLSRSLTRPFRLLLFHPIIQIDACLSAWNYGILYLFLSSFSELWVRQYNLSIAASGLHYLALCIGEVAGAEIAGFSMDRVFVWLKQCANGETVPEYHIPLMVPGAIIAPIGLFLYGWAAEKHLHWLVVDLGVVILSMGMQVGDQAIQAYVIDTYPDHTSSATGASQFLRSLTAFAFPLFAPKLYEALGYGWGNTVLGFAAIAILIPAPFLLWRYGERLRAKAKSSH